MKDKAQKIKEAADLLERFIAKTQILVKQTDHVYGGGDNAGWLIDDAKKWLKEIKE